jgi:hypothetical protein
VFPGTPVLPDPEVVADAPGEESAPTWARLVPLEDDELDGDGLVVGVGRADGEDVALPLDVPVGVGFAVGLVVAQGVEVPVLFGFALALELGVDRAVVVVLAPGEAVTLGLELGDVLSLGLVVGLLDVFCADGLRGGGLVAGVADGLLGGLDFAFVAGACDVDDRQAGVDLGLAPQVLAWP